MPEFPIIICKSSWGGNVEIADACIYGNSAVVAVTNTKEDDTIGDWSAYRGVMPQDMTEEEALKHVAAQGDKIPQNMAFCQFPELRDERYRN
jgi:hypothetical protein